ncbi:PREDICTED: probable ADP-ribosylation factor GTPase-activating protein AGD14 [Tarenaya hassleriana]|uniref:probable ADP-ribosylation factor GTPase-activating protein AGD14 n=1 Tax=Tarenaya hassleriana TaxID=28532 RepID=UPI00053CA454|nr:PREDICTED: probable ADP-ribosylation factor GTPase-activating protein AGD14 [Tarenaya hassleriana]
MGSRREEERNEKIIRGLMKLPPNRRCINCNSMGPQYVCTTFWTFVCIACSGIHREFTHRVKSVSMAKFTSQEVEALQNGGNQRAREMYLKNWDYQRQRLPDSSNADRVREFIKHVYVQKKYAGVNPSNEPPSESQTHGSSEIVTRRSESYHSYSQSPPYDYQYEERRYGKLPLGLTNRSASERGLHAKAASFAFSPGRFRDHTFEDQFRNEGSAPRASDFSVSSGGDPFRSETESPNFQKEVGFSSPRFQHSKGPSSENLQRTANLFPDGQHQRTTSFGSVRSFDSNSMSVKSCNSGGVADGVTEIDQSTGSHQDKTSPPAPSSTYGGLDLFGPSVSQEVDITNTPSIDLFQLPGAPVAHSVNTFQPSAAAQSPPVNSYQPSNAYPSASTELFAGIVDHQATLKPDISVPNNEGWATFDIPVPAAKPTTGNFTSSGFSQLDNSSVKIEGISQPSSSMQWPLFPSSANQPALSVPGPWHEDLCGGSGTAVLAPNSQWNAFDHSIKDIPFGCANQVGEPADGANNSSSKVDQQHLDLQQVVEASSNDGIQPTKIHDDPSGFGFPGNIVPAPFYPLSLEPVMEEPWPLANDHNSSNPFDLPYDSELEPDNMFLDMSSLHTALPSIQPPATFHSGVNQPWFAADFEASYPPPPAAAQGGLTYMTGQASTSQLQNTAAQEPVASIGGNPFA